MTGARRSLQIGEVQGSPVHFITDRTCMVQESRQSLVNLWHFLAINDRTHAYNHTQQVCGASTSLPAAFAHRQAPYSLT